jgi:hypothetical protein
LIVDGTAARHPERRPGEIEFSSAADDPDELPLDFDPLGALIQVAQDTTIVLSGRVLADSPGVSVCTPSESTTPFTNAGADPDASGDVRLRTKDDCDRDFRVEVEDLPVGAYDVIVGGTLRGTVDVVDDGGGATKGEIEFERRRHPGDVLPTSIPPDNSGDRRCDAVSHHHRRRVRTGCLRRGRQARHDQHRRRCRRRAKTASARRAIATATSASRSGISLSAATNSRRRHSARQHRRVDIGSGDAEGFAPLRHRSPTKRESCSSTSTRAARSR